MWVFSTLSCMQERSYPMKSMLHEASTVSKAIQKAWEQSGKPEHFSIKILEPGEVGFLWFSKRPAIVSITYEPKQQNQRQSYNKNTPQPAQDRKNTQQPSANGLRQVTTQPRTQSPAKPNDSLRTTGISSNNARPQSPQKSEPKRAQLVAQPKEVMPQQEQAIWTSELAENITTWLKEMVTTINGNPIDFSVKLDGKSLHITFARPVLESRDSEKNLFMSFAYLLIQALKKKCKKKLRGFHLLITSKHPHNNDAEQASN